MLGSRRRSEKEISVLHWCFRNNYLFPSSSRTFRTQSHWSFITGQCCNSARILPSYLPYWMYFSIFILSSTMDWYLEVRIPARDKQYSFCLLILRDKEHKDPENIDFWMYHVVHNTCTTHGRNIKTRYIGSILILRFGKDWHSIRLDRMQSSFKERFQLIVFQKLLDWRLEKSYMRKHTCHLDHHQRSRYVTIGLEGKFHWVLQLINNQKEKLFDSHKKKLPDEQNSSNQPNQSQSQSVIDQGNLITARRVRC